MKNRIPVVRPHLDALADHPTIQATLLMLLTALLYTLKLGGNGLANYDDCFYAQKAKEILQSGSWLHLTLGGMPAFENPPFFMWLLAFSYKIFGVGEFAALLPSALMGFGAVFLTYRLAKNAYGPWEGLCAGFVLATTTVFAKYSRRAMMDTTMTFLVLAALSAFRMGLLRHPAWFLLFGAAAGTAIMTKSVLGFFPLLIAVLFLAWTRRFRVLFSGWFLGSCLLALGWGGVWYAHETWVYGKVFLDAHFGWLIFQRGFHAEPQPWWHHLSYLRDLLVFYWPWLPVSVAGGALLLRSFRRLSDDDRLILLWPLTILAVMSAMQTRVFWYILPAFPAFSIWAARALGRWVPPARRRGIVQAALGGGLLVVLTLGVLPVRFDSVREPDVRAIAPDVKHLGREAGTKIGNYRLPYHGINNALLFYSDHAAYPEWSTPEQLREAFADPATVLCVIDRRDLDALQKEGFHAFPVRMAWPRALIANRPVDTSGVVRP